MTGFRIPTHKYGTAKRTEYNGVVYSSRYESQCAYELDLRMAAKEVESWENQVKIPLVVSGFEVGVYVIDFVAKRRDGVTEYIEAKGYAGDTREWRLKWNILRAMMANAKDTELIVLWQDGMMRPMKPLKKI